MAGSGGTLTWSTTSVTLAVGETITVNYTTTFNQIQNDEFAPLIASVATFTRGTNKIDLTGTAAGTVTIAANTTVAFETRTTNALTIIVTSPTDDQNFLNERGLAHFWSNINSAMGWKCLGCVHTETATNQLDFTLPAQYDNYKIIASSVISTNATNGAWQTLSPLNGSALLNFSGFLEKVEGTNWSCEALTSKDYVSQNTTYPYFSVFHEVLSMRSMSSETRHYMTTSVSGGGSTNGRTTRGNFHGVVSTEPTGFRLRMASNYIRSGSIYVWGMNNPT